MFIDSVARTYAGETLDYRMRADLTVGSDLDFVFDDSVWTNCDLITEPGTWTHDSGWMDAHNRTRRILIRECLLQHRNLFSPDRPPTSCRWCFNFYLRRSTSPKILDTTDFMSVVLQFRPTLWFF